MKIPVTRGFDTLDPIGMLTLRDDVEISPDAVFAIAYRILEQAHGQKPAKIQVTELSLIHEPTVRKENVSGLTNG